MAKNDKENNSPAASTYGASRPASSHAFSSPLPHSPISLPPPGQPKMYTFVNGTGSQYSHGMPNESRTSNAPMQLSGPRYSPVQASPTGYSAQPSSHVPNGTRPGSSDNQRRSSINLPSPLSGAPVLSNVEGPNTKKIVSSPAPATNTPGQFHPQSSPPQMSSPMTQDPSHASALPLVTTGLSPTKHSPPRPSTSNGGVGSTTPSVLPPVTSLSPMPQYQNLTPPVKPSEPEVNRANGQAL